MMIKQIVFTIITFANFGLSQNYGSLRITNYADDRKSAFSFTFDDGLLTHSINVRPILNQHGFKATFYVLPPYLADENQDTIWRYGTWPDFQSMTAEGNEIGSHTMQHYDLTTLSWGNENEDSTLLYELYQSKIFIEQKIPSEKCISLNYPYTLHNDLVDSAASLYYESGRTLGQVPNDSSLSEQEWYGVKAKIVEFSMPRNSAEDDLDELYTFLDWMQNSIDNHKWGMLIIHDVVPFTELQGLLQDSVYEPITNEWLGWLCDFLSARSSNKDIWVETVGNITRYIKERDDAEYQIISSTDQLLEINVTDELDNEIYNFPLSAYIKTPNEWNYVRTQQNSIIDTLTTTLTDTGRVVLVKVIPDRGNLKLTPVTSTSIDDEIVTAAEFQLFQNYPNPFNPSTKISWQSPISSWQSLKIFDVLGNQVASLVDEFRPAGIYNVQFTMYNDQLSSGIYFYQLKVGSYIETKKMILLK